MYRYGKEMNESSNDLDSPNETAKEAIEKVIILGDERIGSSKYARQAWNEVKGILREKYDIEEDRSNYADVPFEDPVDRDRKRYSG